MKISGEISISSLICRLALDIKAELNGAFQRSGVKITTDQWSVLKFLWHEEGLTQCEIAEKVNKDKASITRILDILQNNNLIKRCNDERDRRCYRIFLTEEGLSLKSKLVPVARATNQRISQNLNEDELKELQRMLLKLADRDN